MKVYAHLLWMFGPAMLVISPQLLAADARVTSTAAESDWTLRPTLVDPLSDFREGDGVSRMVRWNDGSGDTLYVVGDFDRVGDRQAEGFARWDGKRWVPLHVIAGDTFPYSRYSSLVVLEGRLIAAGSVRRMGQASLTGVMEWNGLTWVPFQGAATDNHAASVYDLSVDGGHLLAHGWLNGIVPGVAGNLALWNGSVWVDIPAPAGMRDAVLYEGMVHASGDFLDSGNVSHVARWSGTEWEPLVGGPGGVPDDLEVTGGLLVASDFIGMPDAPDASVATWNGLTWTALPGAPLAYQNSIAAYGDGLVSTRRTSFGIGSPSPSLYWIGFWDGLGWDEFPAPGAAAATFVRNDGEALLFSGWNSHLLTDDDDTGPSKVLRWTPESGLKRFTRAAAHFRTVIPFNGGLLFGGGGKGQGWDRYGCVAHWLGDRWVPLGTGIPDCGNRETEVVSLASDGDRVMAAVQSESGEEVPERVWFWSGAGWVDSGAETAGFSSDVKVAFAGGRFWLHDYGQVFIFDDGQWISAVQGLDGVSAVRILEFQGQVLLVAGAVIFVWQSSEWQHFSVAPSEVWIRDATVHDDELLVLDVEFQGSISTVWSFQEGGWVQRNVLQSTVDAIASTEVGLVLLGKQTWIERGGEMSPLSECVHPFSFPAHAAASLGNELMVVGVPNRYHNSVCVLGSAGATSVTVRARPIASHTRSYMVRATVSGTTAPAVGVIGIDGVPGGSCTIDVIEIGSGESSWGECRLDFDVDAVVDLKAEFYGGGISQGDAWLGSQSERLQIEVGSALFLDSFESRPDGI